MIVPRFQLELLFCDHASLPLNLSKFNYFKKGMLVTFVLFSNCENLFLLHLDFGFTDYTPMFPASHFT